jgi:hypothetical protein
MEYLLAYYTMVTVPDKMVALERMWTTQASLGIHNYPIADTLGIIPVQSTAALFDVLAHFHTKLTGQTNYTHNA